MSKTKPTKPAAFKHIFDPARLVRPHVAIIGFTDHRVQGLNLGDDWEVWGINELHRHHDPQLFHRWFEIHPITDFHPQDGKPGDLAHLETLAKFPIPVYMQEQFDDIPPSLPFPKASIEEGLPRGDYQTSSISREFALAILWGAKEIGIFGVDMANDTEYAEQRPCLEYWMGVAEGRGIKVTVPDTSDLVHSVGQYGWGGGRIFHLKLQERLSWLHGEDNTRLQTLRNLESEYAAKKEQLLAERNQILGSIQDCSYWLRSWSVAGAGEAGAPTPDRSKDPRTGIKPGAGVVAGQIGPAAPGGPSGVPERVIDRVAGGIGTPGAPEAAEGQGEAEKAT